METFIFIDIDSDWADWEDLLTPADYVKIWGAYKSNELVGVRVTEDNTKAEVVIQSYARVYQHNMGKFFPAIKWLKGR